MPGDLSSYSKSRLLALMSSFFRFNSLSLRSTFPPQLSGKIIGNGTQHTAGFDLRGDYLYSVVWQPRMKFPSLWAGVSHWRILKENAGKLDTWEL